MGRQAGADSGTRTMSGASSGSGGSGEAPTPRALEPFGLPSMEKQTCVKCREDEPPEHVVYRGAQVWCRTRTNNYKMQMHRRSTTPHLKKGWKACGNDESLTGYRGKKHTEAAGRGVKRSWQSEIKLSRDRWPELLLQLMRALRALAHGLVRMWV